MGKMRLAILTVILTLAMIVAGCQTGRNSQLDAVRVEATRQAVSLEATKTTLDLEREALDLERTRARAAMTDPLVAFAPWALLLVGLASCLFVGYRLFQVYEARLRLIRRKPEEGEPIWIDRDRFALPLRSSNMYADLRRGAERSPLLAESADLQEQTTLRQQAANLVQAQQAAKTVEARTGRGAGTVIMLPGENEPAQVPGPALALAPSPVRVVEPGQVKMWLGDVETRLLTEVVDDGD